MGKCSVCGEKIEYNQFRKVDGKIYCSKCTPEKELDPEVVKAEEEAKEQFEKDMADAGEITKKLADTVKDSKVTFGELAAALSTVDKKPRKKRVKK
jgi:uncharacterized Zn finger protein (UPF0148 family)